MSNGVLNIVVLMKQVPDSGNERHLNPADSTVDRAALDPVINEMDEYAIEEALRLTEAYGGEVTLLTMGPDGASQSIRKALSMGATRAIHVNDAALHGSCAIQTSRVLAAALGTLPWELVICGAESTDGQVAAMAAMLAERLEVAQLTGARKLTVDPQAQAATIERQTEGGYQIVQASLPAIVSVWDTINEPRYPSFRGIMQAKSKPVTTLSLAELGIDPAEVGQSAATSMVVEFAPRPPRQAGTKVDDKGDGGRAVAEFLAAEKLV